LGEAELVGTYHWRNMNITTWLINRAESRYPPCVFWMRCYLFHYNHDLSHEDRLEWEDMISAVYACTRDGGCEFIVSSRSKEQQFYSDRAGHSELS
jgi:hypothetical protein